MRLLLSKRYLGSVRSLSEAAGGPRLIPLAASEDDDDRFAKRKLFFDNFVTDHGMKGARFQFIHVTGTKGKGTVCELVRCGLIANGRRVGTFTSPHLHSVRERIRVGNRCIPQSDFARLWQRVQDAFRAGDTQSWAVFFDKVLALALAFFIEEKVEYVILEVGIGGRYDSTNFITEPAACVVTSVSMDHMDMLGNKIEMIAWQKAGIMKKGCLAVTTSRQPPAVLDVMRKEAAIQGATLLLVDPDDVKTATTIDMSRGGEADHDHHHQQQHYWGAPSVQAENMALARTVLERLGYEAKGFENAYWPGRFEVLGLPDGDVSVVVDAAHNSASIEKTLEEVENRFPDSARVCIFGTGVDKDQRGMIEAICRRSGVERLLLVQASHPRAAKVETLGQLAKDLAPSTCDVSIATPEVSSAMIEAISAARKRKTVIVAFGSFYVVSAARAYLAEREPGLFRPDDWAFQCDEEQQKSTHLLLSALGLKHVWRIAKAWVSNVLGQQKALP